MSDIRLKNAILPEKYHFVSKANIQPAEIIALRKSVNWRGDTEERWQICISQSLSILGVRNTESRLVGMACIAGNLRHAVLCDLVVHPDHQNRGVGAAIMAQLLRIAEELEISYLYAELADANPFRSQMIELGFEVTGNSLFKDTVSN